MKRSGPPRRKTPLKRGSPLPRSVSFDRARTPLKTNGKQRRRPGTIDPAWQQAKAFVHERSGGRCEGRVVGVCTGRGEHVHHVILRSRGGPDEPWNLVHLCLRCHDWAHGHPAAATELGLMRSMPPTECA